jgi:hypothetical protein
MPQGMLLSDRGSWRQVNAPFTLPSRTTRCFAPSVRHLPPARLGGARLVIGNVFCATGTGLSHSHLAHSRCGCCLGSSRRWIMDQDKTGQAARILAGDEIAQAKFEAQLKAHREKTARLRAERLARMEASWVERRKETIANIKSGLVELQIKTVLLKARRLSKVDE